MQIKRSNDLKIKVQPFCAHPSKACGVQVVKKNSHCGAYPLEEKKIYCYVTLLSLDNKRHVVKDGNISWSLLTRIKNYWMQQTVHSSIISLKARKILSKRELLAFNWILSKFQDGGRYGSHFHWRLHVFINAISHGINVTLYKLS